MQRLILSLALVVSCGCGALSPSALGPSPSPLRPRVASTPTQVPSSPIPTTSPDLGSLDEDIGSVLAVSWSGSQMSPTLRKLLVSGHVGGVLLFASNFSGPGGLKVWSDRFQALASSACLDHPILTMLDEEGGQVNRVQASFAPPSELVAGSGGAAHVRAVERASGAGLRSLGVGLNLAPVADVRTNPRDQVIGDRSFGSNPTVVAPLVGAAVMGLHDGLRFKGS